MKFLQPVQRVAAITLWIGLLLVASLPCRAETPEPEATNLWQFKFASSLNYNSSKTAPAIAPDGTIYVGSYDGTFYAITPAGQEKWRFKAGREIKSSPAIADDGTIYFGSRDRKFYALTPAGKLKWWFATGAWVDASPAIAKDGTICFGSWDKMFYALNPDGSLKWKFAAKGIVDSSPAIAADGTIYFGSHDKIFYALNPDGTVRWNFLTGGAIISSPAIDGDGSLYFSSTDGNLYHLKSDGAELWRCRIGGSSFGSPVLADNGNIFVEGANKMLIVSPAGNKFWSWESPCSLDESAVVAKGMVCWSAPWRTLWARQADGSEAWRGHLTENGSASLVITEDGRLYCCCVTYLQAVQPPLPMLPAKSSWPMFRANARNTGRVGN
jgi:outer membrane protein assembly factor BamB